MPDLIWMCRCIGNVISFYLNIPFLDHNFSGTGMITIPLNQTVTVTAGQRRAFYVTMTASNAYVIYGKNRTTDTASTIIVQDTYLVVDAGSAVKYPFGSDFVSPRFFVGRIAYMTN
jgi:hypothetical protein